MLSELHLEHLGLIERLALRFGSGLTVVTGETGAGKTMLVGGIELVLGARADTGAVRHGANEARVDARFELPDAASGPTELVLGRVVPRDGRSRAYVDGRPATIATVAERAGPLVDLHGQHAHQSLLRTADQRAALDRFANVDVDALGRARAEVADAEAALAAAGGDERARARELDLVRFQVAELDGAHLDDPDEEEHLAVEEEMLASVTEHRRAALGAVALLDADGTGRDAVAAALRGLADRTPFAGFADRLAGVLAELDDVTAELRAAAESLEDDPERLAAVRERRQLLRDLCRKYGDRLADVVRFRDAAVERLAELEGHDEHLAGLERARDRAVVALSEVEERVGARRRRAAPELADAVTRRLPGLAMPHARLEVRLADPAVDRAADRVELLLAANPGAEPAPLAKVASGGELSRAMLAIRLALLERDDRTDETTTLVFDEVDAGLGGAAAVAVADALAGLARRHQVIVVTHLAQVAAVADHHLVVRKTVTEGSTSVSVASVEGAAREAELARMLSGSSSDAAREHARELLSRSARSGGSAG